jgi:hypothetical protein
MYPKSHTSEFGTIGCARARLDQRRAWSARAERAVGGRFQIAVREVEGGRIYDVKRSTRQGSDTWRSSYLGLGLSLERAQGIAQPNYWPLKPGPTTSSPSRRTLLVALALAGDRRVGDGLRGVAGTRLIIARGSCAMSTSSCGWPPRLGSSRGPN